MHEKSDAKIKKYGGVTLATGILLLCETENKQIYVGASRSAKGEITTTHKILPLKKGLFGITMFSWGLLLMAGKLLRATDGEFLGEIYWNKTTDHPLTGLAIDFSTALLFLGFMPALVSSSLLSITHDVSILGIAEVIAGVLAYAATLVMFMSGSKITRRYHGAEHKVIECAYKGLPINSENVKKCNILQQRCGTCLEVFRILVSTGISLTLFSFISINDIFLRTGLRIAIFMVVALSARVLFPLIFYSERSSAKVAASILSAPGIFVQKILTVREPQDAEIEVALIAMHQLQEIAENTSKYIEDLGKSTG